jgi:RNA polymerase sigma factor (sigma-70 family)
LSGGRPTAVTIDQTAGTPHVAGRRKPLSGFADQSERTKFQGALIMGADRERTSTGTHPSSRPTPELDITEMVTAAREGDARAWKVLMQRYTPLIDSVCRQYRISVSDGEEVGQVVWLRLFENLARLRDARALPGWIKTTTRNEALRTLAAHRKVEPIDPSVLTTLDLHGSDEGVDRDLLRRERDQAVRDGLAELVPEHRRLLVLLHTEPRVSYQEISITLGIPTGSIGPNRARYIDKLRKTTAVQTFASPTGRPDAREAA